MNKKSKKQKKGHLLVFGIEELRVATTEPKFDHLFNVELHFLELGRIGGGVGDERVSGEEKRGSEGREGGFEKGEEEVVTFE